MKIFTAFASLCLTLCFSQASQADTFGSGANQFDIDFVTIGNPGNADDNSGSPNPAGKVDYTYRIGQFEISEDMIDKANAQSSLSITHQNLGPNKPATAIGWPDAAQFVNWLNTNSGSTGAYKFNGAGILQLWAPADAGYNPNNLYRNSNARYFLPSMDEWYKAAFYSPTGVYYDYPTGSDSVPDGIDFGGDTTFDAVFHDGGLNSEPNDITDVGVMSPYGTAGQGGNVWEWEETDFDLVNDASSSSRGLRGGDWGRTSNHLLSSFRLSADFETAVNGRVGFRVASIPIPEPNSLLLGALASVGLLVWRRRYANAGGSDSRP